MNIREQAVSFLIRSKLAEDTRTFGQMIDVYVVDDNIYLVGTCDTDDQCRVAVELVRGLPGVRQVIDNVRIRGVRAAA